MSKPLFVSVIIPVHNGVHHLEKCLAAIGQSEYPSLEVIVVDDASTDASRQVAMRRKATVYRLSNQSGPSAARNYGAARANGEILLFVDSDVLVRRDTVSRVVRAFTEDAALDAVFGSYDDDPPEKNFSSQYKNLLHHFVHQMSSRDAATFWAGCGAIRKEIFDRSGGFDEGTYRRPCIEDIELGYRLKAMGCKILLDKDLQVKHLKMWQLKSVIFTDIFARAVPWTKIVLNCQGKILNDLNLQKRQRLSAALSLAVAVIIPLCFVEPRLIACALILLALILGVNYGLFRFFLKHGGWIFAVRAFGMHCLYFFYSATTFAFLWACHKTVARGNR